MTEHDPKEIVQKFISAINSGDVDSIHTLMTDDHRFIDADGEITDTKEKMNNSWQRFFKIVSGYNIKFERIISENNRVALNGEASGTFFDNEEVLPINSWMVPASWFAVVEDDKIKEWRLICNLEPAMKIYRRIKKENN